MPDKEIMLQIRAREEQRPWAVHDVLFINTPPTGALDHADLGAALRTLAEDWRETADLYDRAKGKGFKTVHVDPLRHAAAELDKVVKGLEQPPRAPLGQLQPQPAPSGNAGLDEPRHLFRPGDGGKCDATVARDGDMEYCDRFASHPAHRLDGPTELPALEALIAGARTELAEAAAQRDERLAATLQTVITHHSVDFPGQVTGDEVTAYLRGDVDDIPGSAPLQPSSVRDQTPPEAPENDPWASNEERAAALLSNPAGNSARQILESNPVTMPPGVPPVPLLGQPGDAGRGYSHTYIPPGGVPAGFTELLTPVPVAFLPPHISHSQIETAGDCAAKYRLQRLPRLGADNPSGMAETTQIPQWAQVGGSAFHAAVEDIERAVIAHGTEVLGGAQPESQWRAAFDAECQKIEASSPVPRSRWRASKRGAEGETWWNVNGPLMLDGYLKARPEQPTLRLYTLGEFGIELEVVVAVQTPYGPIDYKAIIDRITWDERRGVYVIRDYKTGASMPDSTSQLGEYANVMRLAGLAFPDAKIYGTFYNARKGTWTPEVDLDAEYPAEWFTYLVTTGHAQRLALTQGPTPARPSSFCGGCSVRWACPVVR